MTKRRVPFYMLLIAALLVVSSCTKDELGGFGGNYTFKTGGYVTLAPTTEDGTETNASLSSESGQMDIIANGGDGKVLITMNILKGTALVIDAVVDEGVLRLSPFTRIANLTVNQSFTIEQNSYLDQTTTVNQSTIVATPVTISGTARKLGNMIVFDLTYQGDVELSGEKYSISSSHVEQIAKEN